MIIFPNNSRIGIKENEVGCGGSTFAPQCRRLPFLTRLTKKSQPQTRDSSTQVNRIDPTFFFEKLRAPKISKEDRI
jgi:hypothetical protein